MSDGKDAQLAALKLLREPFEAHQISKLPKPTKQQTDEVTKDYTKGMRCELCGAWHHPKVVHLDYVGHAALTDRLLDVDPLWDWAPLATDDKGLPLLDEDGGMWIRLTVCGMTRLGYGDAQNKLGPNATKERIGDALRNAGMRFGAALELWHKGILHMDTDIDAAAPSPAAAPGPKHEIDAPTLARALASIKKKEYTYDDLVSYYAMTEQQIAFARAELGMDAAK